MEHDESETIRTALGVFQEEKRRTAAVDEFAATVTSLDPSPPNTAPNQTGSLLVGSQQTDACFR